MLSAASCHQRLLVRSGSQSSDKKVFGGPQHTVDHSRPGRLLHSSHKGRSAQQSAHLCHTHPPLTERQQSSLCANCLDVSPTQFILHDSSTHIAIQPKKRRQDYFSEERRAWFLDVVLPAKPMHAQCLHSFHSRDMHSECTHRMHLSMESLAQRQGFFAAYLSSTQTCTSRVT